jgi:hypothetical protein
MQLKVLSWITRLEEIMVRHPFLLISTGVLILLVVVAFVFLRTSREPHMAARASTSPQSAVDSPATPVSFAYKTAWFAVKSNDSEAVARALGLKRLRPASWKAGIDSAYDDDQSSVFVTPPIHGWVLVVGRKLLSLPPNEGTVLLSLSRQFAEAQFFATMRISDAYMWERAQNGELVCSFDSGDGEIHRHGNARAVEKELDLRFFDDESPDAKTPGYYDRDDLTFPDQKDVLKVAALWSVDPSQLDREKGLASTVILGSL